MKVNRPLYDFMLEELWSCEKGLKPPSYTIDRCREYWTYQWENLPNQWQEAVLDVHRLSGYRFNILIPLALEWYDFECGFIKNPTNNLPARHLCTYYLNRKGE